MRQWLATCITILMLGIAAPLPAVESVKVIASPQAPVETLTQASLRAIFSMRLRHWPGDGPVIVYVLPDSDEAHVSFTKQILRIFPYVLRDNWDRLVFTGTGSAPIEVKDQDELLRLVGNTPGAIGYVQNGQFVSDKVKVLAIR